MFTYQDSLPDSGLSFDNRKVLVALGVTVRLDYREPIELAYQSCEQQEGSDELGGYRVYRNRFADEETKASVEVAFRCYGSFVLASVQGSIHHDNAFGKQRAFAAENGIVVTMKQGEPIRGLMANYQHKDWWTRPHFETDLSKLPDRTQSLLWKTDASYYQLLPVVGPVFRADLGGAEGGLSVRISAHQGARNSCDAFAFILGGGEDPYELMKRHVDIALKQLDYPTLPRDRKTYPEILDYLGWCSWDAFYHKVNEEGLLAKAAEMKDKNLPVRWVVIDDGWSNTVDGKLQAFEADAEKFPQGLAHAIGELKQRFGISWVGVWHTIAGYWGGIHPDSEPAKRYADYLFETVKGSLIPYPDAGRGFGFWNAWHSFLRRQGVDFVKVDSQSAVSNFMKHHRSVGEAAGAAHQALEASVALHFNKTIINCMGMAAENIWHRPNSAVSRNSDDFVPREQKGFQEHALQNAYNSYYHGSFYWGDWDMFWTVNHDDVQNAVLRSVSGGPVYFSDAVGKTDPAKVWPLIYKDGKLIRCDETPSPTADCLLADPTKTSIPLKLWNKVRGTGAVAAFHISESKEPVAGTVGLSDVPGLEAETYVLYEHFSRECKIMKGEEHCHFQLAEGQCALYLLIPVRNKITPIGLIDKYISTDAVVKVGSTGQATTVLLKEGGAFAFVSSEKPDSVLVGGVPAGAAAAGESLYVVDCGDGSGEITVEIRHRS